MLLKVLGGNQKIGNGSRRGEYEVYRFIRSLLIDSRERSMANMNGANALVKQLISEGVDTVFALPGAQIMTAFDAMHQAQDDISLIHTRHEQATTYMADGFAKVTGRPGVAMVTPGPGALNAASGLGTAYACSSPVLLVSGQIPSRFIGKGTGQLHEVNDQLDVFKPITKWNYRVSDMAEIPIAVHEAFRQLTTGNPGPVELEIAPDIMTQIGEVEIIEKEIFSQPQPFDSDIQRAVELIASSKQPTIIAGGGTILSGASEEVTRLAELIQAAVMTTPQGKGVIDENSHLSVGVNSAIGPAGLVLPESDLVIAVGTRLSPRGVQLEVMPTLIQIDIDPSEIGRRFDAEVGIIGDARQCLSAILSKLETVSIDTGTRNEDVLALRKKFKDEVERLAPRQLSIIDSIRNALHDDAIVVQGETNIGHWSSVAFTVGQPKTYLASSYFGTLGYSYPTALGCQAAFPGRQVIALCGDGGFMYSPQELSTAMTYGLNVVAVVFNNGSFGSSKWDQEKAFSGRYIGTDLVNPDFVVLAESFGAVGVRTNAEGIGDAIKDAFSRNSPVVVDVEIENMMPPFQIVE